MMRLPCPDYKKSPSRGNSLFRSNSDYILPSRFCQTVMKPVSVKEIRDRLVPSCGNSDFFFGYKPLVKCVRKIIKSSVFVAIKSKCRSVGEVVSCNCFYIDHASRTIRKNHCASVENSVAAKSVLDFARFRYFCPLNFIKHKIFLFQRALDSFPEFPFRHNKRLLNRNVWCLSSGCTPQFRL